MKTKQSRCAHRSEIADHHSVRLTLAAALVLILMTATLGRAHHPGVVLTGFGTATVDGVMTTGEWDSASRVDFLANLPASEGGGTTPVSLYVMNDETHLYLAARFMRTSLGLDTTSLFFEFDNNHDGQIDEGDDAFGMNVGKYLAPEFWDDYRTFLPPCPANSICGLTDSDGGGTNDGTTAVSNDGDYTVIELSHPLTSGDSHDFSLSAGDRVGFVASLRLFSPTCNTCFADTDFPSFSPADRGDIVIAPTVTLVVTKEGTGTGTVASNPGLLNCGPVCEELYGRGTEVALTATATGNSKFAYWTGCDSVTGEFCIVRMNTDKTASATFVSPLTLGSAVPPSGEAGLGYNFDLPVSGGLPPYNVTLTKGALPAGLTFGSPKISGTPSEAAKASFTVRIMDQLGASITKAYKLKVLPVLDITTNTLKPGTNGRAYKDALKGKGGDKSSYKWTLVGGSLPPGLLLTSSTGVITGTPTQQGTFEPIFQLTDRLGGSVQKALTLTIK